MIAKNYGSGMDLLALNAVKLSPKEVARSFIAPPAYDRLRRSDNALLTGPRGSGKTTLLKMLQSEALENWDDPQAERARSEVKDVGVFVGSDPVWSVQLHALEAAASAEYQGVIVRAAFATQAFKSLVAAANFRLRGPLPLSGVGHLRLDAANVDERAVSEQLARLLQLNRLAPSLRSIGLLLDERTTQLGVLKNKFASGATISPEDWIYSEFKSTLNTVVATMNEAFAEPDRKWALLIDEMELAPTALAENLLSSLRGDVPSVLYKFSMVPAHEPFRVLTGAQAPVPGQDYEAVSLTSARKKKPQQFAQTLVIHAAESARNMPAPPLARLLGDGILTPQEDLQEPQGSEPPSSRAYELGGKVQRAFSELSAKDASFAAYLARHQIDPETLRDLDDELRASHVRKIRNLVLVRNYFRSETGTLRSRKTLALYSGADSLLALPDGNPRLLIALARGLFESDTRRTRSQQVPRETQSASIEKTRARFWDLLEAQEAELIGGNVVSLPRLVDAIGGSLRKRLVEDSFNENVPLTFRVPPGISPELTSLIVRGINTGAFIHIEGLGSEGPLSHKLTGKHLRLSYLLATKYGLPLTLGRVISLGELVPRAWVPRSVGKAQASRSQLTGDSEPLFDVDSLVDPTTVEHEDQSTGTDPR